VTYTLFLDDVRDPTPGLVNVLLVRNVQEAKTAVLIKYGVPDVLSLDHDLGENEPTAMEFLHWLIERHLDGHLDLNAVKAVTVHSANPVGAENLRALWDGFAEAELDSPVRAVKQPRD
jgi:hypothetical protein